jgi:AAA domain
MDQYTDINAPDAVDFPAFDQPPRRVRFKLERLCDIEMPVGDEWRVKGVLPKEGVGTCFGESGHFKSFAAIDLAWHVATGARWAGRKVEPATVVYLAAEAPKGVRKRLSGASAMHGLGKIDPPLHLIGATLNLGTDSKDLEVMIADIEAQDVTPGFIIVDTLSASMGSGEENGAGMTTHLGNCQRLAQHFGAFVLVVCHIGHNGAERERGHSSLMGNTDTRIFCAKADGMKATLTCKKVKDGKDGDVFSLSLEEWVFGQDRDGDPITTLVVRAAEQVEAEAKQAKKVSVPPQERLLLDTVVLALIEAGKDVRPYPDGPQVKAVAEDEIRSRYYAGIAEKADPDEAPDLFAQRQSKAFRRSLAAAIKAKRLVAAAHNGRRIIWLP